MKKIILIIVAILCIHTCSYASTPYFNDTNEHWSEQAVETLRNLGIIKGENNNAYPDRDISRGELSALIARAMLNVDTTSYKSYFTDVDENHIFAPYICAAYEAGIINGVGNNMFMSEKSVTREEIALMISRISSIPNKSQQVNFKDIKSDYKYYENIKKVCANGIINGYSDNTFRPLNNATRGEVAKMILSAMKVIEVKSADIKSFAFALISNDSNYDSYIGQAKSDMEFINEFKNKTNASTVKKNITSTKIISSETMGMLSTVELQSDIKYEYKNSIKSYIMNTTYEIVNKDGILNLYNFDTDLVENKKINLTWEVYGAAPTYAPDSLTHVSPSAFVVSSESHGKQTDIGLGNTKLFNTLTDEYLTYAKNNNYSVWAMYKTDFKADTARALLNNQFSRYKVIEYLINQCLENEISGINFDFENMYKSDAALFANHVKEMALVMHEIGVSVSADITRYEKTSAQWSMCYDRDKLGKYADYIMLMAYDQYYAGSKNPGPVGGLSWVEDSIKLTLKEVDNGKLILGIPFYIRYWESKNNIVTSTRAISMETAQKLIKENNPKMEYIQADGQYRVYWSKGDTLCSFWLEDVDSIKKRINLSEKYSLAGVASWRRGLETEDIWNVF